MKDAITKISTSENIKLSSEQLKNIIFSSNGDFADGEITLTDKTEGVEIIKNMDENEEIIVKGIYDLKNLSLFSKCQTLCGCVELYLKNNFPMIIKYQVANLGHVLLVLSTVSDNNIIDDDDDDDDDDN
jgi:proliferating cell nuclear antigen